MGRLVKSEKWSPPAVNAVEGLFVVKWLDWLYS